jgi:ABC-type sugar transport system ATPase subunit
LEQVSTSFAERLQLSYRDQEQTVMELSGGNQQKVVLSKWLMTAPKLLILDEPTRGVDVGAKHEVHKLIREQAEQGLAVLMISSDLPEALALSDRILVMREGTVVAEFEGKSATQEQVMFAATGQGAA